MSDPTLSPWLLALIYAAGSLLGAGFFGGLWWTVRHGTTAAQPALWFLASLILRSGIAFYGFFLLGGTDWRRWLAAMAGFVMARVLVGRVTCAPLKGASDAP